MSGLRVGSLFSGYRGLDGAVEAHFGATPAWSCDNDPDASRLLAHHWPALLNIGDITAVDWSTVEPVDILTGGWPCQPWSVAGKRKGKADSRALWPEVERAVRALRPRHVVLENVPGIVTAGELARAVGDLAALGYVGSWECVGAHEAGAPHRRQRIFIVATDTDRDRVREQPVPESGRSREALAVDAGQGLSATDTPGPGRRYLESDDVRPDGGTAVRSGQAEPRRRDRTAANPASDGRYEGRTKPARLIGRPDAAVSGSAAAAYAYRHRREGLAELNFWPDTRDGVQLRDDADRRGVATDWGSYRPAIERWERILGRPAPAPTVDGPRGGRRLNPELPEWMMGLPLGYITAVPGLSRNAMLRLAGNGVVPQQAALALSLLAPSACVVAS